MLNVDPEWGVGDTKWTLRTRRSFESVQTKAEVPLPSDNILIILRRTLPCIFVFIRRLREQITTPNLTLSPITPCKLALFATTETSACLPISPPI